MRISVEIPIHIDEPLTADEHQQFRSYMQQAAEVAIKQFAEVTFAPGARMYGTVCRFSFDAPTVKVE